jgi:hypothetical protein
MYVDEQIAIRALPADQHAFHCSAGGAPLLDIYEFDASSTVGVIWNGRADLGMVLGAAAHIGSELEAALDPRQGAAPEFNVTYIADETLVTFPWRVDRPRTAKHRAFLREFGYAVSYVHCDALGGQPYSLWAQVHAPLAGQIGFCAPAAPEALYAFMACTDVSGLRTYHDDIQALIARHVAVMRERAKDEH